MKVDKIRKKYGNKVVLKDISFEAEKGLCVGILGGNGSGKSTLLNILAGIHKGGGSFVYKEKNLMNSEKIRAEVLGYVPQSTPLLEELNAYDNLRLWYDKEELKKELENGVLKMLGIDEFLKVRVSRMSGGMKKRLAIGCAVAHKPEILLLDEPSAALDLICKEQISSYLKNFKMQGGIIILATHDIQEIPLCDKLFILKDGVLVPYTYDGDLEKLVESLKK